VSDKPDCTVPDEIREPRYRSDGVFGIIGNIGGRSGAEGNVTDAETTEESPLEVKLRV
jgi:hypothetical protein